MKKSETSRIAVLLSFETDRPLGLVWVLLNVRRKAENKSENTRNIPISDTPTEMDPILACAAPGRGVTHSVTV